MTPVMLLSDGYLANGAEPWLVPSRRRPAGDPGRVPHRPDGYLPVPARPRDAVAPVGRPGTPGLEHRIGGLEKEYVTGNVSYAPANHEQMVRLRAEKIAGIAHDIPPTEVHGPGDGRRPGPRLGQHLRRHRERRRRSCAARGTRSRTCTCAT